MADWILREGSKSGFRYRRERRCASCATRARWSASACSPSRRPGRDVHIAAEPARRGAGVGTRRQGAEAVPLPRARRRARAAAQVLPRARAGEGPPGAPRSASAAHAAVARAVAAARSPRRSCGSSARASSASAASATRRRTSTFGIATLRKRHVEIADERAVFTLRRQAVDPAAAGGGRTASSRGSWRGTLDSPGTRLFRYQDERHAGTTSRRAT